MDRKNRVLDLLDAREELLLTALLKEASFGEAKVEDLRQSLCEIDEFEPYKVFQALQSGSSLSFLSVHDCAHWLKKQPFKVSLLNAEDLKPIFQLSCSEQVNKEGSTPHLLRYESFLRLVLPKEDPSLRADVLNRCHSPKASLSRSQPLITDPEVGFLLVQLLEAEAILQRELLLRKKRLFEHEWEQRNEDLAKRAFVYLQSKAAVPGVGHLSTLGVSRLLGADCKNVLHTADVERLFRRILFPHEGSLLLSFREFEKFLCPPAVTAHLNELYVKQLTTQCPGCGARAQRDGGACRNVTCGICRTTFVCKTDVVDWEDLSLDSSSQKMISPFDRLEKSMTNAVMSTVRSPETVRASSTNKRTASVNNSRLDYSTLERSVVVRSSGSPVRFSPDSRRAGSPQSSPKKQHSPQSSPKKQQHSPSFMSTASTAAPGSPQRSVISLVDLKEDSASSSSSELDWPASLNRSSTVLKSSATPPMSSSLQTSSRRSVRQQHALALVSQALLEFLELDAILEKEKTALWQNGLNVEAAFGALDRFKKGYVSDCDIWQQLQMEVSSSSSYTSIVGLIKDAKRGSSSGMGLGSTTSGLGLAEFTKLVFPRESEEWQNVTSCMSDSETRNVLYVVRATISCPGCGLRSQRSPEGCPSVTCPVCSTSYRCNLIGEDHDQTFRLSLAQRRRLRHFLLKAVHISAKCEEARERLLSLAAAGTLGSFGPARDAEAALNSLLLDAYLGLAGEKSVISFEDIKRVLLAEALDGQLRTGHKPSDISLKNLEGVWWRVARGKEETGFVDFAHQLRPGM